MRVGIVDVGANTVRLLVATAAEDSLVSIREERDQLGLGEEIERTGRIGEKKLAEAAETAKATSAARGSSTAVRSRSSSPRRAAKRRTAQTS